MGMAATVNPVGASASLWNPAVVPDGHQVSVAYTDWGHAVDPFSWRPWAIRADLGRWTVSGYYGRFKYGPVEGRTAYEPDGTGEILELSQSLWQFGGSYDVLDQDTQKRTGLRVVIGSNVRTIDLGGSFNATDVDLGTSVVWTVDEGPHGWIRIHGTLVGRNLLESQLGDDGSADSLVPRQCHLGVGLEAGMGRAWRGARMLQMSASYAWHQDVSDQTYSYDSEHFGVELTWAAMVSVRRGHRDRGLFQPSEWSWGAGLKSPATTARGLWAGLDYGTHDQSTNVGAKTVHQWTLTVGADLPY